MINNATDMLTVRRDDLDNIEIETVDYLEFRMEQTDERGMLARLVHQLIANGKVTAAEIGERLGAYDPEGIILDDDLDTLMESEVDAVDESVTEELPAAPATLDETRVDKDNS